MKVETLMEEAGKLARPSIELYAEQGTDDFLAVWGGDGSASIEGPYKHRMTVDFRYMPDPMKAWRRHGCLSLYTHLHHADKSIIVCSDADIRTVKTSGTKLYGRLTPSLPLLDAFAYTGSPEVMAWANAPESDPEVAGGYEEYYDKYCPLYSDQIYAVLGGWHYMWPDSFQWEEYIDRDLLICTFKDAEPWIEVWDDGEREYEVIERMT
ncbi:hypothetical protein [Paenibacillus sp. y28]|uniref:hypothetical protein n=1 Tax=Paenibacillus sp. y28 TaxID=3129110 RepID=UPI00301AD312